MSPKQQEEAACPVCGKMVSLDVAVCPHCGAEFEEEEEVVTQAADEGETAACPVCGKMVGLDVAACPHCGAEFEEEEEAVAQVADEGETAACPVCGKMVSLDVAACPKCGAEFEEEEVEEIIEVEERQVPAKAKAKAPARAPAKAKARREEPHEVAFGIPTSIMDLRVIGVALVILGIFGAQVAAMIDWYWTWVPPIEDNLALFVLLPVVVLIIGLLLFVLVKKAVAAGGKVPGNVPGVSLSLFLFGIIALIVMLMWDPINSALQSSKGGVAGGFLVIFVVGVLLVFMGMRTTSERRSPA